MLSLDKYVNGVVSIGLSFIDIEELMFVNVYIIYISSHYAKQALLPRDLLMVNENPMIFTVFGSGYFAMIII